MKRKILVILVSSLMSFSAVACGGNNYKYPPIYDQYEGLTSDFLVDDIGDFNIHTELQSKYLNGPYLDIANYADGSKELSRPLPVKFSWKEMRQKENLLRGYTVKIAEDKEFKTDVKTFETKDSNLEVYNLKINQRYYYTISSNYANNSYRSKNIYQFQIVDEGPRNLYIDGISNCRDLGGHKTEDGGVVRQGLLYRTARLNKSGTDDVEVEITEKGIKTMKEDLGVKTEIDLRGGYENETGGITMSPLGREIYYYHMPMAYGTERGISLLESNLEKISEVFGVLSHEKNYPAFYHCSIGTDRTGVISILIGGLLGVSKEELFQDYLFSNFGEIGTSRTLETGTDSVLKYMSAIEKMPGKSFSYQVLNYLLSAGVSYTSIGGVIYNLKEGGQEIDPNSISTILPSTRFKKSENIQNGQYGGYRNYCTLRGEEDTMTALVTSDKEVEVSLTGLFASSSTSCLLNEALSVYVNDEPIQLCDDRLGVLGARTATSPFNVMQLGKAKLKEGKNLIKIKGPTKPEAYLNVENISVTPCEPAHLIDWDSVHVPEA